MGLQNHVRVRRERLFGRATFTRTLPTKHMIPAILRLMAALTMVVSLVGCAATSTSSRRTASAAPKGKVMTVRTTAYTHTEPGGRVNAIGSRLHYGGQEYSAASDWSWMPLGTRFRMLENGRTFVIEDYGSALVGRQTVDLYMPTRALMRQWGMRYVQIEILSWGSKAMSLKLLAPRSRNSHVARMCAQLRKDGVKPAQSLKLDPPTFQAASPTRITTEQATTKTAKVRKVGPG